MRENTCAVFKGRQNDRGHIPQSKVGLKTGCIAF